MLTVVALGAGAWLLRTHQAEGRREAIRQTKTFVETHQAALREGSDFLQKAGPRSAQPSHSPVSGRPIVRTSAATGARTLGALGGPCDYLLAEHDRIAGEHQFTRVVASSPDPVLATGMLRRWADVEVYLRACIAQDEPAMGLAADALLDDLPSFEAAQAALIRVALSSGRQDPRR